jgi:GNAT superfamily N-acetyltransferase
VVGLISANLLETPTTGMYRYSGPIVWIGDIVVTKTARGHGIGGLLLAEIEAWARSRGAAHLQLNMHYGNAAALGLYERNGYRPTDIRLRKDL